MLIPIIIIKASATPALMKLINRYSNVDVTSVEYKPTFGLRPMVGITPRATSCSSKRPALDLFARARVLRPCFPIIIDLFTTPIRVLPHDRDVFAFRIIPAAERIMQATMLQTSRACRNVPLIPFLLLRLLH